MAEPPSGRKTRAQPTAGRRGLLLLFLGFAAVSLLVYRVALGGAFVSDDHSTFLENPYAGSLTSEKFLAIIDPWGPPASFTANYAPVHLLVAALEWDLFGENVVGYHVVNVVLHAANATLLVALLMASGIAFSWAAFAGGFFLLHPANVEAVAWINQVKSLLAFFFALSALLAQRRHPLLGTLLFGLALLSKASALFALPMFAALTFCRFGSPRESPRRWAWVGAWLFVFLLYAAPQLTSFRQSGESPFDPYANAWIQLWSVAAIGVRYLAMAATGYGVSAFHEPPPTESAFDPWCLAALPAAALLAWRVFATLRRRREEAAWWLAAAAAYAPISQIFAFYFAMADRYLYMILPGLIGGVLLLGTDLAARWGHLVPLFARRAAPAAGVLALLALGIASEGRARLWLREPLLLMEAAANYPDGGTAHYVRAYGRVRNRDLEGAMEEIRGAVDRGYHMVRRLNDDRHLRPLWTHPEFAELVRGRAEQWLAYAEERGLTSPAHLRGIAGAHFTRGEYDEAEAALERALRAPGAETLRPVLLAELEKVREKRAMGVARDPGASGLPNVLLIVMDTTRSDHLSAYGYERTTTARLETLAAQGTRFEVAYAPAPATGPSHASLFTGLHPLGHGLLENGLGLVDSHLTLAERLSAKGYQTAAFVSSYLLKSGFGFAQGFDLYDDDFSLGEATEQASAGTGAFDRRAGDTSLKAMHWLDAARDPSRPFFLFVHFFDPHLPYGAPEPFRTHFAGPGVSDAARGEEDLDLLIAMYDAEIAFTDWAIGTLLQALGQQGLTRDTLVLLTADHGEGLMQHGVLTHAADLYEESVRIPLIVRWPGRIEAGRVLAEPVALPDLLPTILELLGEPLASEEVQGESLAPALLGRKALPADRPIYLRRRHYDGGTGGVLGEVWMQGTLYAVREGRWKYIEGEGFEIRKLFDLEADPGETSNRFFEEPEVAARLAAQLDVWKRESRRGAPVPGAPSDEDRAALRALGYTE